MYLSSSYSSTVAPSRPSRSALIISSRNSSLAEEPSSPCSPKSSKNARTPLSTATIMLPLARSSSRTRFISILMQPVNEAMSSAPTASAPARRLFRGSEVITAIHNGRPAPRRATRVSGGRQFETGVEPHLRDQLVVHVQRATRAVGAPPGRGEEAAGHPVRLEDPRHRGREAVTAPQVDARGQQPAAVTAAAPPRLHQQVGDGDGVR